jgi:monovalent cation/hydrogen antiporter
LTTFEWLIGLLLGAVLLSALARRIKVPYPTFLAIGGMLLAFVQSGPSWTLEPDLALALFVAPVLLDAAFDTSLRDLRDNWLPVSTLVFIAVGLTTAAVAVLAHWLLPDMPWAAAIALGAIVAPPDAAAATAILRQVNLPYRILKILEGESLLNDASALLIYRVAVGAAAVQHFKWSEFAPSIVLALAGSLVAGYLFARTSMLLTRRITDAPSSIIVQFAGTFTVWIVAEHIGLSGILTIVAYAITIARTAPARTPAVARARLRGVGHRRLCAQRAGVHADRDAAAADLGAARRSGATGILRSGGLRSRHRDCHARRLGDHLRHHHAVFDCARCRSPQAPNGRAHR